MIQKLLDNWLEDFYSSGEFEYLYIEDKELTNYELNSLIETYKLNDDYINIIKKYKYRLMLHETGGTDGF
jgi:hypothetical protein